MAIGFGQAVQLNPVGGDQEYVAPPEAFSCACPPEKMLLEEAEIEAVGSGATVMATAVLETEVHAAAETTST